MLRCAGPVTRVDVIFCQPLESLVVSLSFKGELCPFTSSSVKSATTASRRFRAYRLLIRNARSAEAGSSACCTRRPFSSKAADGTQRTTRNLRTLKANRSQNQTTRRTQAPRPRPKPKTSQRLKRKVVVRRRNSFTAESAADLRRLSCACFS